MVLIAEFTIPADLLAIGRALSAEADQSAELERIVPTNESLLPYVWTHGDDLDGFETRVEADAAVAEFSRLADLADRRLYELTTSQALPDWIPAILNQKFTILSGIGTPEHWEFTLRFPTQEAATSFHRFVMDRDLPHTLERVQRLESVYPDQKQVLTAKQREALSIALQEGYFDCPRETTLTELADELGRSESAVSTILRRGHSNLLRDHLNQTWQS